MKVKSVLLLFFFAASCLFVQGQGFFKAVPKVQMGADGPQLSNGENVLVPAVTTMTAVRPVTNIVAYQEPGHKLMAGAGVAWEKLKWDAAKEKWMVMYSVAAMVWAGGSPDKETENAVPSYGVQVGFFNNLVMLGPVVSQVAGKYKFGMAVGIGINLNN